MTPVMSIETEIRPTTPKFASIGTSQYPVILAVFCGLLLISNIGATKLIEFGPTSRIFTSPDDKRTQDYITGRFG